MKEKKILEETRDLLLNLREICMKDLDSKKKLLEDDNGKIKNLISTAEKMMLEEQIENLKNNMKAQQEELRKIKKKFREK